MSALLLLYIGVGVAVEGTYKGQTCVDKLTNKGYLYFTTKYATSYPEVGKSYIMSGNVYEGKFYAAEHNILETITDPSLETMFTKRFQAYDCSCRIDTGLYPGKLTTTTTMCVNPSPCQSYDYCYKKNGKCTWKCF